ncbi:MAG TPA: protein-disulfide reductase DsbD domain-containing protein, partial [Rhizomicrobium sp.]|nr:protein-disulfide reductase DsbD domain-containing protein [Rhizomicrobium sp.]
MRWFLLALAFLAAAAMPAAAQVNTGPKVHAQLIAEAGEIAPGKSVTVALEEDIAPGWHTYWSNPGEAGLPSEIKWTLPPGWKASGISWPYPKRLPVGPLMNYGYENKVWLLTT